MKIYQGFIVKTNFGKILVFMYLITSKKQKHYFPKNMYLTTDKQLGWINQLQ